MPNTASLSLGAGLTYFYINHDLTGFIVWLLIIAYFEAARNKPVFFKWLMLIKQLYKKLYGR